VRPERRGHRPRCDRDDDRREREERAIQRSAATDRRCQRDRRAGRGGDLVDAAQASSVAMSTARLDSRTWLVWGLAAIVPLLVARNPHVVLAVLLCATTVRSSWAAHTRQGWGWIVRLAFIFVAVGVVFNALTVHAGNQVLVTLPGSLPLIG